MLFSSNNFYSVGEHGILDGAQKSSHNRTEVSPEQKIRRNRSFTGTEVSLKRKFSRSRNCTGNHSEIIQVCLIVDDIISRLQIILILLFQLTKEQCRFVETFLRHLPVEGINIVVLTRFKRDYQTFNSKGGKMVSTVDHRVSLMAPKNAFRLMADMAMQVHNAILL